MIGMRLISILVLASSRASRKSRHPDDPRKGIDHQYETIHRDVRRCGIQMASSNASIRSGTRRSCRVCRLQVVALLQCARRAPGRACERVRGRLPKVIPRWPTSCADETLRTPDKAALPVTQRSDQPIFSGPSGGRGATAWRDTARSNGIAQRRRRRPRPISGIFLWYSECAAGGRQRIREPERHGSSTPTTTQSPRRQSCLPTAMEPSLGEFS